MRITLLALAVVLPCAAQFRQMDITFTGSGCESCIASLPGRLERIRGVEAAVVTAGHGTVSLRLAAQNRVRFEQIRDAIEQDGTKVTAATVELLGIVAKSGENWTLQPSGLTAKYEIDARDVRIDAGTWRVRGTVADSHPRGMIRIKATSAERQ